MGKPEKYLSIIVDAMDQRKTCLPYFCNPLKNIANEFILKLKLIGAIVHGLGNFVFWLTQQISGGTNVTVECIRRLLLVLVQQNVVLPPTLYTA